MQIKTSMRYNLTSAKIVFIKKTNDTENWREYAEKGILILF